MDIFTPKKRSEIMSRIRGKKTKPEAAVYRILRDVFSGHIKIEQQAKALPGTPDFYIHSLRLAVFIHGCFWHCCPRHGQKPSTNTAYWLPKLEANLRRDRRAQRQLNQLGIAVWRFWEHDLKRSNLPAFEDKIRHRVKKRNDLLQRGDLK